VGEDITKNVVNAFNILLAVEDDKAKELLMIIELENKKTVPHYE